MLTLFQLRYCTAFIFFKTRLVLEDTITLYLAPCLRLFRPHTPPPPSPIFAPSLHTSPSAPTSPPATPHPPSPSRSIMSDAHQLPGRRVFVKHDDNAGSVSRKISMAALPDAKQGFPVRVNTKHASATNVGIKAAAIATARLAQTEPAKSIAIIPSFRDNRSEISLFVDDISNLEDGDIETTDTVNFTVGGKSDPKASAGAIANAARERKSCTVQAIGADAVFNAVKAIAIAREYLEDKDDGVDLYITVGFTKVRFEGRDEDTTAVKYTCYLYEGSLTIYH